MKKLYLLAIVVAGNFLTLECSKPAGASHQRKKSTLTQEHLALLKKMLGDSTVELFQKTKTESDEQKTAREKTNTLDSLDVLMNNAKKEEERLKLQKGQGEARAKVAKTTAKQSPKAVSACAQVATVAAKA